MLTTVSGATAAGVVDVTTVVLDGAATVVKLFCAAIEEIADA